MSEVAERLHAVRASIARAAKEADREDDVALVAVTKTVSLEHIREAHEAGQRLFGENRVQELTRKMHEAGDDIASADWHLIGHLQTNKVAAAVNTFSVIESVDTLRLARKIDAASVQRSKVTDVMLEVNVPSEASKSGFDPDTLFSQVRAMKELKNLRLRGLMTVAPLSRDPEEVRPVFSRLRQLRDDLRDQCDVPTLTDLSMGMSNDYGVAIGEGATIVRIGRAIFGSRPPAGGQSL